MKSIIIAVAAMAVFSNQTMAHASHIKKTAKHAAFACPVTGDKIASAKAAYNSETYKGKKYYFCCPDCKPRFDKNRDLVIKHAAQGKYEKM